MGAELKSFGTLFGETWEVYKRRALTIFGVLLLCSLLVVGGITLAGFVGALSIGGMRVMMSHLQQGQFGPSFFPIIALFSLVVTVLAMWCQSATIAVVVDESLGVLAALRVGWKRFWSMGWVLFLVGAMIMGGFLLLVVPGIILSVSLMFALYPLYEEDVRGMDAVLLSRRYVRGRWWNTFGKLLLVWLVAIVLNMIPAVGPLLYFIFTPFLLLFLVALYRNLKETAPEAVGEEKRGRFWLLVILGLLLPTIGFGAALFSLGPQLPMLLRMHHPQPPGHPMMRQAPVTVPSAGPGASAQQDQAPQKVGKGTGVWHDPVGDVAEFGVGRWLDIETVTARADAGTLLVEIQPHVPLEVSFNAASTTAQSFYRFAVLLFDTDGNRETGGVAGQDSGRTGYDLGLDLTLEGPRNAPNKGQVHVGLFRVENGLRTHLGPLPAEDVVVQGQTLRLRIPYVVLGVQEGNQLRMSFIETMQKQGSGLSKDKLINL